MKHLIFASLMAVALPLTSSAFFDSPKRLYPEEIILACSNKFESIQKMEEEYTKIIRKEPSSFSQVLSSSGLSLSSSGAIVLFSAGSSSIVVAGPVSMTSGSVSMYTSAVMNTENYDDSEKLRFQIVFASKEEAEAFVSERAFGVKGLQTEKFKAQCHQQALNAGDDENHAKYYCNEMLKKVTYGLETGKICPVTKGN